MMHAQICSYLDSSDATRIGLVVSFDDIHVMTMNDECDHDVFGMWIYIHMWIYIIYTLIIIIIIK